MVKQLAATLLVVGALIPRVSAGQRVFGFGGVEVRSGVADPKNADKGLNYAIDADLGYLRWPILRTYVGLTGFSSDVDLRVGGTDVGGSLKGLGLETGVRLDLWPLRFLSPSLLLGFSFTDVTARDVNEPATSDMLDGFYPALDYGVGLAWHIGRRRAWSVVGDLRGVTGSNVGRTVATVGVRWQPRGSATYQPEAQPTKEPTVAAAAMTPADSARIAADRQRYSTFLATQRSLPGVPTVRETDSTVTIVLDETVFDATSGGLSPTGQSTLRTTAASLAAYPNATVRVEGYSDSTGSVVSDQRASDQRAEAVRAALIAGGVNPARLTSSGYGATRPVGDNSTPDGRARNRRVEIVVGRVKE
jgi:outer membrane protein OmpA-like peptidoglycan-associated protein